ncbi:transposase [Sphingomonas sp. MMS24-J13]|uniref:transposase n=1 Tax=Sphingomonas sp. MMS24-J13 TaxID=3238686 RepID=UPI00384CFD64
MARLSRIVIPDVAHHVTQRGNRRLPVFFGDDDRILYLRLVAEACRDQGTRCLAWCLMDNHIHLILVPARIDGLRATLAEAHRRYSRHINFREGWRGYLFQGRFASYPMDDAHLMVAVRYVERNPVAAGLVERAEDWRWSSARSHIGGRRAQDDPLTDVAALSSHVRNWRRMLVDGLEAAGIPEDDALIEARISTGRPLAEPEWIADAERRCARTMAPQKRGPKPKIESLV